MREGGSSGSKPFRVINGSLRHIITSSEHFVSGRPSRDFEDVDYVPTIFKDAKRRWIPTTTQGQAERAQKKTRTAKEAEEVASILMDLSDSFASRTDG